MMSYPETFRPQEYTLADQASREARAEFILKTYVHLFGAIIAFAAIETALIMSPVAETMLNMLGTSQYSWLLVLGAFMVVGWIANKWALNATSIGMQYAGLGLYVVAEAVIFLPLLYIAANFGGPGIIPTAGIVTLCAFTGLTATAVMTRKNFSFLGPFLGMAGLGALGLIVASILFGFELGNFFAGAMILLAGGYILYQTSNVLHEYRIGQHVAAALALFASVALLFYYIVVLLLNSRD